MLYSLYVLGIAIARILPLKLAYVVAEAAAWAYFVFATKDKKEMKANLRVVLGEEASDKEIEKHILMIFKNFAKYLADFFKFPRFTEEHIIDNIEIEGIGYLDEALAEGKGAVALSLHLGNWELGAAVLGGLKYPISGLVLEHKNERINRFFKNQRAINGFKSIPLGAQVKECFKTLRRNEVLAIVGDKNYTSGGIGVDFFGKKAVLPKGPAVFSIKTGAPIVFCALTRKKGDTFKFSIEKPIKYEPTGDNDRDTREVMNQYLRIFEKHIKQNPDQWYVFRKIWEQETITQ